MSGRPLRFLGGVLLGWVGLRTILLWPPAVTVADGISPLIPRMLARAAPDWPSLPVETTEHALHARAAMATRRAVTAPGPGAGGGEGRQRAITLALLSAIRFGEAPEQEAPEQQVPGIVPGLPRRFPAATPPPESRWSGSGWLFLRGGQGLSAGQGGGQIGGAQAGVRLAYALDTAHRLALFGRLAGPLRGRGTEAAAGVEWQPTRLPVRVMVEQRLGIDGVKSAPAVGLVGGAGPTRIMPGMHAEGYAQAGVIGAGRGAFVDGAARVAIPLGALANVRFDLGAGAWGAAQKGAARLDLGPSLAAALPLGKAGVRLSIDWRQRVAGGGRPDSGLVVTLGTDF